MNSSFLYKQGSRWRALDNQTLCSRRETTRHPPLQHEGKALQPVTYLSTTSDVDIQAESRKHQNVALLLIICLNIIQKVIYSLLHINIFMFTSTKEVMFLLLTQFTHGIMHQIDSLLWYHQQNNNWCQDYTVLIRVVLNEPDTRTTQPEHCFTLVRGEHNQPLMISAVYLFIYFFSAKGMIRAEVTETNVFSASVISTADPTMIFFSMDYGKCS